MPHNSRMKKTAAILFFDFSYTMFMSRKTAHSNPERCRQFSLKVRASRGDLVKWVSSLKLIEGNKQRKQMNEIALVQYLACSAPSLLLLLIWWDHLATHRSTSATALRLSARLQNPTPVYIRQASTAEEGTPERRDVPVEHCSSYWTQAHIQSLVIIEASTWTQQDIQSLTKPMQQQTRASKKRAQRKRREAYDTV